MEPRQPIEDRFFNKVSPEPNSGCWLWIGATGSGGYGAIGIGSRTDGSRRNIGAHRLAYELFVGSIPDGLEIDHLCRVRCCVNPAHLEPVTRAENIRRGIAKERRLAYFASITHCPRGHPYDEKNTYIQPKGWRACRACDREKHHERKAKRLGVPAKAC